MKNHKAADVPSSSEDMYFVVDDFGALGRCYRKTDEDAADRETLMRQMVEGQFHAPVRVIAFNLAMGWARDVSAEIALRSTAVPVGTTRNCAQAWCNFLSSICKCADLRPPVGHRQ